MTSSITPITAVSNDGAPTGSSPLQAPANPECGIARLRETEVYHLMCLVQSALHEAEEMVLQVLAKARVRWLDHANTSEPLNADEISRLLGEAFQCATLASTYIDRAAMGLLDSSAETPL